VKKCINFVPGGCFANGNTVAAANQLQLPQVVARQKHLAAPNFAQDGTAGGRFKLHVVLFRHNRRDKLMQKVHSLTHN
jgi:hypothetical protein